MSTTREDLVRKLIRFDSPIAPTLAALAEFGWDCDAPLVTLDAAAVLSILQRYSAGSLTAADVEDWASAIECRDDIDTTQFKDVIFELASPDTTRKLTLTVAAQLREQIQRHES